MPRRPSSSTTCCGTFDDDAYIPHQIAGDDEDEAGAVLIASPDIDTPMRALVINLRDAAVDGGFDRVLEVVPADDSRARPVARALEAIPGTRLRAEESTTCNAVIPEAVSPLPFATTSPKAVPSLRAG